MTSSRGYSTAAAELTPRMRAVLLSAARGRTARETALELFVSEQTVKTVRAAACARLGASNVTAAVYLAASRGELH